MSAEPPERPVASPTPAATAAGAGLRAEVLLRRPAGFTLRVALVAAPGVTVLLGPSGVGKSSMLDLLAGHLLPTAGRITLDGRVLYDGEMGVNVPPQQRRIGYVMQSQALFPHLSVRDNLLYGLFRWPRAAQRRRLDEVTEELQLAPLLQRKPASLSGGERQRVALGRALGPRPQALLLDEPLSAVDLPQRDALLKRLRALLAGLHVPVVYVTHSAEETRFWGGRALLLRPVAPGSAEIEMVAVDAVSP